MGIFCRIRRVSSSDEIDFDKNWDFVHFALTERTSEDELDRDDPDPLGFIGDDRLGAPRGEDLGFGPGRLFFADDAVRIADALDALDETAITSRLESSAITQCYPCNEAVPRLSATEVELVRDLLNQLRTFVRACVAAHDGFVVEMY